jgi:hypothetical protein
VRRSAQGQTGGLDAVGQPQARLPVLGRQRHPVGAAFASVAPMAASALKSSRRRSGLMVSRFRFQGSRVCDLVGVGTAGWVRDLVSVMQSAQAQFPEGRQRHHYRHSGDGSKITNAIRAVFTRLYTNSM